MSLDFELYWSFRRPYSYIVLPRIVTLVRDGDVMANLRVVHPNAIRTPNYFGRMDPLARPYFFKDTARAAAFHGLPFRRPVPDPIVQDPETLALAPEQPLARFLSRLGIAATLKGRGLECASEVSDLLWNGKVDGWNTGPHLADACARAGLDLEELKAMIDGDPRYFEDRLDANDKSLHAAGHWGVPTMVFEGEPFFGQDRFDMLVWRMRQRGLTGRPT